MKHSTFNYVRTCRQRHALTADELVYLIGERSRSAIARFESGERVPSLKSTLGLQVVFGLEGKALFPEFYEHVEDAVMRRARDLYEELEHKSDARSAAKRALLESMARRREDNTIEA